MLKGDKMTKKVLIAEDDASIARALENQIKSWGFSVARAPNGWEAYILLADNLGEPFFAVVSDMRMPGGSGLHFCQAADRLKKCPPTLVHSSDLAYKGDGIEFKDICELKEYFDFVQVTHLKPKLNNDFGYVKEFLDSITA